MLNAGALVPLPRLAVCQAGFMAPESLLLDVALPIALRAAELVKLRRSEGVEIAASKSSAEDIVTLADRESETLIRDALAEARPDDGFFGEESGAGKGTSGITWVVDPIDGTVNYAYDIPAYAVSIAAVEGDPDPATWRALAGVVVNPVISEVFTGRPVVGHPSTAGHCRCEPGSSCHWS